MVKFLLSIFMLLLMPLRLLFVISVLLNLILFFAIHSFVLNDSYFHSFEYYNNIKQKSEKILDKSCSFGIKCSLKIYALDGMKDVKLTFEKTLNEKVTTPSKTILVLESIKSPIKKLLSENDLKTILKNANDEKKCFHDQKNVVICKTDQLVAIFKAENCPSCVSSFKKEFASLEKPYYKSFIIKMSHKVHDFVFGLFGVKESGEKQIITEKLKNKIYENFAT